MNFKDLVSDPKLTERQKAALSREAERLLCKQDLFYLAKNVLGYKDMSEYHRNISNTIMKYKKEWQLHLHPRGHFKSTLITVAETVQNILINPNETILITNAVLGNSISFLREIKSHFIHNERFRQLFPEYCPSKSSEEGTSESFTTPARTEKWIRESTIEVGGIDKSVVSRHYGIIVFDDVVNNINVSTKDQREKIITAYKEYLSLLNPGGLIRVIGTRWHYYDLYGHLFDSIRKQRRAGQDPTFKMFITKAWQDEEQSLPAFPERFNRKVLDNLKSEQGSYIFSCQYMNDPQPDEEKLFSRNDLLFVDQPIKADEDSFLYFCSVDPAVSEKDSSDPSVIITIAVNSRKQIFITDISREWINPDHLINGILNTAKKVNPLKFGIETTAFQKVLKFFLDKEAKARKQHINIIEIKRSSHISKQERIKRLQPYFKAGQVFLCADKDNLTETQIAFLDELDSFPYGRYDDILDALTDVIEIHKAPICAPQFITKYERDNSSSYGTGYRYKVVKIPRLSYDKAVDEKTESVGGSTE